MQKHLYKNIYNELSLLPPKYIQIISLYNLKYNDIFKKMYFNQKNFKKFASNCANAQI